eukprot:CAMPEP_0113584156 /NCGR_PEP_ID=MMETSP0015_2-20120614/32942_1 /TAXON_ID=2838 /ORGANISM="Odontella" /LENGTH=109 /DNA_ID=CAMNT_0000489165 /DNA_START=323 /DNA_END=648 /DNA_ORIENTATION=+ /assembly_acc=CAM_ASM_000160
MTLSPGPTLQGSLSPECPECRSRPQPGEPSRPHRWDVRACTCLPPATRLPSAECYRPSVRPSVSPLFGLLLRTAHLCVCVCAWNGKKRIMTVSVSSESGQPPVSVATTG